MLFTTQSGRLFDPLKITPSVINIHDIAHALSNLCRFGGHSHQFYSVAQHSLRVSAMLPPPLKLQGLMHDATEAYIVDLPRPLKVLLPQYVKLEENVWQAIAARFNLPLKLDKDVHDADDLILVAELEELMTHNSYKQGEQVRQVELLHPHEACSYFLREFYRLIEV